MMGKKQKLSRGGHPSAFVPDYRHSVNAAGESEGFGSCGRADSEDSCAPKRRCISLNNGRFDAFDVPSQVISFSKMSFSERRDLEVRLRAELEQVQTFQKKVFVNCGEAVASSSSNRQQQQQQQQKKKKKKKHVAEPPAVPRAKCGVPSKIEAAKRGPGPVAANGGSNAMAMKQCKVLLEKLMSHKYAPVFNTPVDVVRWNIPDYFTIIKHPMDLGTVKSKITSGAYLSPWEFLSDVRLTFTNAMTYNPPKNDVHLMARTLNKIFEGRWKSIEKNLSTLAPDSVITREKGDVKSAQHLNVRKAPPKSSSFVPSKNVDAIKKKMTDEDRQNLSRRLESLSAELPDHIIDFLRRHNSNQANEDEIELDIEALGDDTLFELQNLLDKHFKDRRMSGGACPMEAMHDSVISSSSMPACKGNDSPEEDVDIGGDDAPIPFYPPVEIEKDTVVRNNGYSSSSTDSGSSSSDSDSVSSSESECEMEKAPLPAARMMEKLGSQTTMNQYKSDVMSLVDENSLPGRSVQPQQNAHTKTACLRENGQQMGENATSEKQVSPEKRYQNALKVNRFAETILRAREKTLDKTGKGDPDKLQHEREEFERLQREEKARLQAEAKVAEEAQRQAQAAAAAEAKRQREKDREAARQALLLVEKTVEIDESSKFLKDLEMLQHDAVEQLPSSVDETSPDLSHDGMGSFRLRGSNPLEKLGLFMKVDEDEDDDIELSHHPVKDVEEGEID